MRKASLEMGLGTNDRGGKKKEPASECYWEEYSKRGTAGARALHGRLELKEGQCHGMQWVTGNMFEIRPVK